MYKRNWGEGGRERGREGGREGERREGYICFGWCLPEKLCSLVSPALLPIFPYRPKVGCVFS